MSQSKMEQTEPSLPFELTESERATVEIVTAVLRDSAERDQIVQKTKIAHVEIEDSLASGAPREHVMLTSAAYLIEQLPKVVHQVVKQAIAGNAGACKLVFELCGLEEAVKEFKPAASEEAGGIGPLEIGMLENIRKQIAQMPDLQEEP